MMRHIARALHTFGTQKHPLHVIHEKKKGEKKKMVSGHQELVVSPFLFSLRTFASVSISVSDA